VTDREDRIRARLAELRGLLDSDPALAERFRDWLTEEEDMEKPTTLRLPEDLLERADALVPAIASAGEYQAVRISRSTVLRLALLRGLVALEAEYPAKRKRR